MVSLPFGSMANSHFINVDGAEPSYLDAGLARIAIVRAKKVASVPGINSEATQRDSHPCLTPRVARSASSNYSRLCCRKMPAVDVSRVQGLSRSPVNERAAASPKKIPMCIRKTLPRQVPVVRLILRLSTPQVSWVLHQQRERNSG